MLIDLLLNGETSNTFLHALRLLLLDGRPAHEVYISLQLTGEGQTGFERGVVSPQVCVPVTVT